MKLSSEMLHPHPTLRATLSRTVSLYGERQAFAFGRGRTCGKFGARPSPSPGEGGAFHSKACVAVILMLAWTFTAGIAAYAQSPDSAPTLNAFVPHPPKAQGERCVAETDFMRRNHMTMLKHQRDETVHEGVRGKPESLKNCITCHAVKGNDGQFVKFSNPKHFCRSCHDYAAVSIDCFECHASRPEAKESAMRDDTASEKVVAVLSRYLKEMEDQR